MRRLLLCVNSLIASIITTACILTLSFLLMLFSSAKDGYRTTYFGSLFFNSTETTDDILEMEFGVENGMPILITIGIFFIVFLIILSIYEKRKRQSS